MTLPRIPCWLDCDPGHDDTFAILLAAYHPGLRLLGISTVFGNASLENTTQNALSVLTAIGKHKDVPVYVGACKPMARPPIHPPTDIHGKSGLDGTALLPQPLTQAIRDVPAIDAMAKALLEEKPNTAWLVTTGICTNAALLLQKYPHLVKHLKGLSIMGGAIGSGFAPSVMGIVGNIPRIGNRTRFAEFNIVTDPEAAASIFDNEELAEKTTLIPLDLTHQVLATTEVQELLLYGPGGEKNGVGKTTLRTMLVELLTFFAEKYRQVFGITAGPPLHDPLAVAAILTGTEFEIPFYDWNVNDPEGGKLQERFKVKVVTEGTLEEERVGGQTGRTIATLLEAGKPGVRIPRSVAIPQFWKVIEECIERADEANAKLAAGLLDDS